MIETTLEMTASNGKDYLYIRMPIPCIIRKTGTINGRRKIFLTKIRFKINLAPNLKRSYNST